MTKAETVGSGSERPPQPTREEELFVRCGRCGGSGEVIFGDYGFSDQCSACSSRGFVAAGVARPPLPPQPLPEGMTAEKLRDLARLCGERAGQYDVPMLDAALTLASWADSLAAGVLSQPEDTP